MTTTYGGFFDLDVVPFSPVCVNDDGVTDKVTQILQQHCADRVKLIALKRGAGSEDFAYFSEAVPSSFYYVASTVTPRSAATLRTSTGTATP